MDDLQQLSVGGILVVMILDRVFKFLNRQGQDGRPSLQDVIERQTEVLEQLVLNQAKVLALQTELNEAHLNPLARTETGSYKWWTHEAVDSLQAHLDGRLDELGRCIARLEAAVAAQGGA